MCARTTSRTFTGVVALIVGLIAAPAAAADRVVGDRAAPCVSGRIPVHATIADAIGTAAPGDTIVVCAGRYVESVTLTTPGLTLRGDGDARVVAPPDATTVFHVGAPAVSLKNLDVSGSRRSADACAVRVVGTESADIRGLRVHDAVHAICVGGGTGHRIRDNVIERTTGIAIAINQAGAEVAGNTTSHSGAFGLVVGQCAALPVAVHDNVFVERTAMSIFACDALVTGNTVRGHGTEFGILVTRSAAAVIRRNTIEHTNVGVKLVGATGGTVSFNTISSNHVGIDVSDSTGLTVTGNTVSGSTVVDCAWDRTGTNAITGNRCGSADPAGAFD